MKLTAVIYPGEMEGVFVAYNPETGTTTQGTDREDALGNLREATTLYVEEFPELARRGIDTTLASFEVDPAHA
ncbi:MAG: type II toxin-antitoxin system HicB family antitoxin [Verrucomicrobia bacterium]|jgi:predicted RNase H-like HicB family nuclease|nr:type II toxin-antitoxin system HicB family antitoxin [Verrucomicrobiota bacterium]MDA0724483.1 type II toxin-antitoxin system HicB family antitoxin [Verrucomicrobiota bacterium]MDA1047774.1 type II toxin-antitoxin system HicB family antitoxin [Verrucomicrobiota bacterium]|tara:strand:- start:442 stop:660 length:219 start_codon:yes stop_codon:yes gene_type:complete